MAHILVIDDDPHLRTMLRRTLEHAGHVVVEAEDGDAGLSMAEAEPPDLVMTDIFMPRMEGLETIMGLRRRHRDVPVIAMSGGGARGALEHLATADKLGAAFTLSKPFTREEVLAAVDLVLDSASDPAA
ncbi:MAG: response regulator [Armatimonadetes bacterium]|nr:response regulator [Armatimonadota bacterium]